MTPRVSVLTAVRNCEAYLGEAIDSVAGEAIACEHVVVDDGSTDATPQVATAYGDRICFYRQAPLGAAAAMNAALSRSTAPYLAILDADDVRVAGTIERQVALLDAHPSVDMTFGGFEEFASGIAAEQGRWAIRPGLLTGYVTGAIMIRREVMVRIGFNEGLVLGWFVDFVMRAREAGVRELITHDLVFRRRVHGANTTIVERGQKSDYLAVARAAIARRRQ